MRLLYARLSSALGLIALLTFISGAGLDGVAVVPAGIVLAVAMFVRPAHATARALEPLWRILALILAARATLTVLRGGGDPVIPMVDLLLLLLCAESLRDRDGSADARHFALTFALLIAAAAYRPGPLFAPLFVAYVVCATVVLVLGHLVRRSGVVGVSVGAPRPLLVRLVVLSTAVLALSAAVFLFFPRVSRGWAARATPVIARSVVGFGDHVSIGSHGARIEPNPEVVLRIEFPGGPPPDVEGLHWRGRSYDHFDGVAWSRRARVDTPAMETLWPGDVVEQVVYARRLMDANVIFGLHPMLSVVPQSRIGVARLSSGDYGYAGEGDPVYRVRSRLASPDPARLRETATNYADAIAPYLQLPRLDARIVALADSFRTAHATPIDVTLAVEAWLRTDFGYTLDLPATPRAATLEHFLFNRREGHCEYFSTAMAVLLRATGIPARNVNGFLGGEWNDFGRFLTVTQNHAHSWVEVFFPGAGWVAFDPTPAAAASEISAGHGTSHAFSRLFDGLAHRWGKWVLDYDASAQISLLDRFSEPFRSRSEPTEERDAGRWWLLAGFVGVIGALRIIASRLRFRSAPAHAASRHYMALRNAYARAGYDVGDAGPLEMRAAIEGAPGAVSAHTAITLYMEARFGRGHAPGAVVVMRERVREAARELRAAR